MEGLDDSRRLTRARMVLSAIGIPMPGLIVSDFAEQLLDGLDQGIEDATNIDTAIEHAPTGVFGLLANEPFLGTEPLLTHATTALDAAELTIRRFAQRVLDQQRRDPAVPPLHPTPAQKAALREAHHARRPDRIKRALVDLHSSEWMERANAATRLAADTATDHREAISGLLEDPRPEVATAARLALERLGNDPDR